MWYLHCELRELSRVRESLVAVAEGDFSFVFTVRGSHGHRREGETISESNCMSFTMAGGVNSAVQRRQVRRKRRPSRPKEAESAGVSTLEKIPAEQPTTASCSVFVLLQYIAVSILKGSLQKVAEEESSLRSLVESLKLEIENVKKEHFELKEKEAGSWKQK
ncbi:hypothetical protein ACOSQ3_031761 [Xanthoceras sorbifolium]